MDENDNMASVAAETKTYTPPPISGYRKLTQTEVDLINEAKGLERAVLEFAGRLKSMTPTSPAGVDADRAVGIIGVDHRNVALGITHTEDAFMRLVRAIAQPTR